MKNKLNRIKEKVTSQLFVIELVFLCGFLIIAVTNFIINKYFGLYFLGISFIALAIFQFVYREKR